MDLAKKFGFGGAKRQIGKYEVIEEIGTGGMGVVYRGVDKQIGRAVAIKTLTEGYKGDPGMLSRFYEEGRRTGQLNHPNIVTVFDLGDDNGIPFIVMELVPGKPLDKLLASGKFISMVDRLRIVQEVCSALAYAHMNKVTHRDVKPANIFVLPEGNAKLLDFGIARADGTANDNIATQTGVLMGTVPYMSPERLLGQKVDGRSDIWATGVVLYQLVTGQLPFTGTDSVLMGKILNEQPLPMSDLVGNCPPALEPIVDRALKKAPDDRYLSAQEMAIDLAGVIAELKLGQTHELLAEAEAHVYAENFLKARAVLNELLMIDRKNSGANELMARIDGQISLRSREEKAQQVRQQAEDAMSSRRPDQSLAILDESQDLFASNPELAALREKALKEKERQDRINQHLNQAELARRKGDYKTAMAAAQQARELDTTNPRIIGLQDSLAKEAEQAYRKAQAKPLLSSARAEILSRRFNEAIKLLDQAEEFDPTNPELQLMRKDASDGLQKARHREEINRIEEQVGMASTHEEFQQLTALIQEAMVNMPSEPALIRLNTEVQRKLQELDDLRLVEETLRASTSLPSREALNRVQQARTRVPGDKRLLELEAFLADRLRHQTVEQHRADLLARAREVFGKKQYADAVKILELAQAEGIATSELLSLLDVARNEEKERLRRERLRADLARGQSLIAESEFDAAIAFLQDTLSRTDDPALRVMFEQAKGGREKLHEDISATLEAAANLMKASKPDDALQLLQMKPPPVQRSIQVQGAIAAIEDERHKAVFRTVGRAYAALGTEIQMAVALARQATAASADPSFGATVIDLFAVRGQAIADRKVSDAVQECSDRLRKRNKEGAVQLLWTVSSAVPYASSKVQQDWERLRKKTSGTGLLGRNRG